MFFGLKIVSELPKIFLVNIIMWRLVVAPSSLRAVQLREARLC